MFLILTEASYYDTQTIPRKGRFRKKVLIPKIEIILERRIPRNEEDGR
jgi:hypothetical protein